MARHEIFIMRIQLKAIAIYRAIQLTALAIIILFSSITSAFSETSENCRPQAQKHPAVQWVNLDDESMQLLESQSWELEPIKATTNKDGKNESAEFGPRSVCFTATRIDLSKYRVELKDVRSVLDNNEATFSGISKVQGQTGIGEFVDYSIESMRKYIYPGIAPMVLFNAGWSEGLDDIKPIGFLKVQGRVVKNFAPFRALSALVCFDSRGIVFTDDGKILKNQPTNQTFEVLTYSRDGIYAYENWNDDQRELLKTCRDVVQVGPKIIEIDNSELRKSDEKYDKCLVGRKAGLCSYTLSHKRRILSVLALGEKSADGQQYLYFLTTENPSALYDLQTVLLDPKFVGSNAQDKPNPPIRWAVNMAGGVYSSLVVRSTDLAAGEISRGRKDVVHASAIVATKLEK